MAESNRRGLRSVKDADMEEYKQKLREHRLKVTKRTLVVGLILALVVGGLGLYMAFRQYNDFDIQSSVERSDTAATRFVEFR